MKPPDQESVSRLANRFEQMRTEQEKAAALIKLAFPVGSEVYWGHGNGLRFGEVIEHRRDGGRHLDLKVRGATGAEYWIGVWGILREMVDGFEG